MEYTTLPTSEYQALLAKVQYLEEQIDEADMNAEKVVRLDRSKKMLEVENDRLEEKIEQLEEDQELMKAAIVHLQKQLADCAGDEELLGLMEGMSIGGVGGQETEEVEALKEKVSMLENARAELEVQVGQWKERCAFFEGEAAGAADVAKRMNKEIAAYQVQMIHRDNALVGKQEKVQQQQQLIQEMQVEGERLEWVVAAMNKEMEKIKMMNTLLEAEVSKKKQEVEEAEEKMKKVNDDAVVGLVTVHLESVQVLPAVVELIAVKLQDVQVVPEENVSVARSSMKRKWEDDDEVSAGRSRKRLCRYDD